MDNTETIVHKKHHGHNVKRLREIIGMKQEALAQGLGVNQQRMSAIEQKEELDDELLERISELLKVPKEAIENFDEEKAINIINNSFDNCNSPFAQAFAQNSTLNINPIEKWLEALKKNEELYDKLLLAEKEKNALLQQLLEQTKK